jgi:hypothetical protein
VKLRVVAVIVWTVLAFAGVTLLIISYASEAGTVTGMVTGIILVVIALGFLIHLGYRSPWTGFPEDVRLKEKHVDVYRKKTL